MVRPLHVQPHDAPLAFRDGVELDRVLARDVGKRNAPDRGDLLRIEPQRRMMPAPHHDRRDEIARARRIVVERAEDIVRRQLEPDLLGKFAQRCGNRRFARIDAPARHRPLSAMRAQAGDAAGEDQRGLARAVIAIDQRDRDGGVLERRATRSPGSARQRPRIVARSVCVWHRRTETWRLKNPSSRFRPAPPRACGGARRIRARPRS